MSLVRRVFSVLLSLAAWLVGLVWFIPMSLLLTLLALLVRLKSLEPLSRLFCRVQLLLLGVRRRVVVHPEVSPYQAFVFVQNHVNHFDFVVSYTATPHLKQGLELADHFRYPFYGWLMQARGTIRVHRGADSNWDTLCERARREVARGHSLLAFPEGTRTLDGHTQRFHRGVFRLARELGLPVVPIAVVGAYDLMRKGSLMIHPFKQVTVHVEAPLETKGLNDQELDAVRQKARQVIETRLGR